MPRSIRLKPLIKKAIDNVTSFREEYEESLNSDDPETDISVSYQSFVENLQSNLEDFQDYRKNQLNGVRSKNIDDELLEDVVSSIFNLEQNENIGEKSERVRQIQNALFWEAIKDFEGKLEYLEDEAEHLKIDEVDTDSL